MAGISGIGTREMFKKLSTEELNSKLNEPAGSYEPWAIELIKDELNQREDTDLPIQERKEDEISSEINYDSKSQIKMTQRLFYGIVAFLNILTMILSYIFRDNKEYLEILKPSKWIGFFIVIAIIINPTLKRSKKRLITWFICILISAVIFVTGNIFFQARMIVGPTGFPIGSTSLFGEIVKFFGGK